MRPISKKCGVSALLVLLSVAAFLGTIDVAKGPIATSIYTSPDPAVAVGPGDIVMLGIYVDGATDLYGWGLTIKWHPPLLEAISVDEGSFLMMGGSTFMAKLIDNNPIESYVSVGVSLVGAVPGVSGGGDLVWITFEVEGTGETALDITESQLLDSNLIEIEHTVNDGEFYTTETWWKANLVKKSAWPDHHHHVLSKHGDINNLHALVKNLGTMDVTVKVVFSIVDASGMVIFDPHETSPYVLTTVEDQHEFVVPFNATKYGPSKYYATAKVKYDINGDGVVDTWGTKVKSFSFAVVP